MGSFSKCPCTDRTPYTCKWKLLLFYADIILQERVLMFMKLEYTNTGYDLFRKICDIFFRLLVNIRIPKLLDFTVVGSYQ